MVTIDEDHVKRLQAKTRDALVLSDAERILFAKKRIFVPYPAADRVLEYLEDVFNSPPQDRPESVLVYGDSDMGKSSLAKKFFRSHPPQGGIDAEAYPVILVEAPVGPDLKAFYEEILTKLMVPILRSSTDAQKARDIKYYCKQAQTRMLLVDEINSILAGSVPRQHAFMVALKRLSNDLEISIGLFGTNEALRATDSDFQIASRFPPMNLPKWKFDSEFTDFLSTYETTIPLKLSSNLDSEELSSVIFDLSDGTIGGIVKLLRSAAAYAIKTGTEKITQDGLKKCGYVKTSDRIKSPSAKTQE